VAGRKILTAGCDDVTTIQTSPWGYAMKLISRGFLFPIFLFGLSAASAKAADLNYVTGGSVNAAYGTNAIQYRKTGSTGHA
jgi:hypothetical protein